jgi:DNA-binding MarR family transcriptional regulator
MTTSGHSSTGYWYPDRVQRGVEILNALRDYRDAESDMRRRTRSSMKMGETDLLAIRFLLQEQKRGNDVTPKELAARLDISSASTTVLIDRLVASGHVERQPNPADRRSIIVVPTGHTDDEVRATLGSMHRRMMSVVESLGEQEAAVILGFLREMRKAVDASEAEVMAGLAEHADDAVDAARHADAVRA